MASSTVRIFSKTSGKPLGKFLRLHNSSNLIRFYVGASYRKSKEKICGKRFFTNYQPDIVRPTYPEAEIPDIPFHEFIFENWGQWEDKVALECGETGKKHTYKEFYRYSRRLAASLQKKFNLKKGDVMAAVLPNGPEYPIVFLAGSMTGVVTTTINPTYTLDEITKQLKVVKPKLIFTTCDRYRKCKESTEIINLRVPIVVSKKLPSSELPEGAVSYSDLVDNSNDESYAHVTVDPSTDDLVLPFSSGTSGLPKGVQLTHRNVVANMHQFALSNVLKSDPDKESNQCNVLAVLPMFHIYGMVVVTFDTLREGSRLVSLPKFEPKLFVETIHTRKCQILYLAPPLILFLGNTSLVEPKHLTNVQHVVSGAAPCGAKDLAKLVNKAAHVKVSQGYGMTETSPIITISHKDRFHKTSSAGHPLPSTLVKVVDVKNGKLLPCGSRGEICVKGPQVMKGYYNLPEETQNAFDGEGWLRTGDIGYYDEDSDFYVVDRKKELIKVKGFQVAPAELEEFLRGNPKIAEVGVIGVKHEEWGQVPKAYVVLKEGVSATETEIQDYIKERLSPYKQLNGGVEFIKKIPVSTAGKILRKQLREMHEAS